MRIELKRSIPEKEFEESDGDLSQRLFSSHTRSSNLLSLSIYIYIRNKERDFLVFFSCTRLSLLYDFGCIYIQTVYNAYAYMSGEREREREIALPFFWWVVAWMIPFSRRMLSVSVSVSVSVWEKTHTAFAVGPTLLQANLAISSPPKRQYPH